MKKVLLGILLASASLPVLAESKFSGELLLGTADQKTSVDGFGSSTVDEVSIGVRGAYTLNKHFAIEAAYHNYGEAKNSYVDEFGDDIRETVETTAINLGIKGSLPFENGFSLYARAGIALWDLSIKETDSAFPGEVFSIEDDGNDIYYGVGAQLDLSDKFFIGAEYTITDMEAEASFMNISFDHEVTNLSVSVGYRF